MLLFGGNPLGSSIGNTFEKFSSNAFASLETILLVFFFLIGKEKLYKKKEGTPKTLPSKYTKEAKRFKPEGEG